MKKGILFILLSVFLLFGLATYSMAEPPEFDRPPKEEQMEKVRERIETLKMWKLTKALDLDENASARVFPLLSKYDKKRAEIEHALRNDMKEMMDALKEKREANLRSILDRIEQNHRTLQKINDEERTDLKKVLTVEQQAKFIIFQQEFDREIRKIIAETRERRAERPVKDRPERPLQPGR